MYNYPMLMSIADFGTERPLWIKTVSGEALSHEELTTSDLTLNIYRKDRLEVPCEASDTEITISNTADIYKYQVGDKLILDDDEEVVVSEINTATGKVKLEARVSPLPHKRGTSVKHIVYQSMDAIEYDIPKKTIYFLPQAGMIKYTGTYYMFVKVDNTERVAICNTYINNYPMVLKVVGKTKVI